MHILSTISSLLLSFCFTLIACTTNPTSGRNQLLLMSWEQERELGERSASQFLSEAGGELADARIVSYVNNIGTRLATHAGTIDSRLNTLNWEFFVVDSDVVNAFALPGGKVYITRGLLYRMNNEAQLAGVLGHEIAHVSGRHANERMSRGMATQLAVILAQIGTQDSDNEWMRLLGVGAGVGGQLTTLQFSRSNETEADSLGVRYMAELGWNPVGQIQVMEILRDASGGATQPEWLSTHPAPDTRITDLRALITRQYPDHGTSDRFTFGEDEFRQHILHPLSRRNHSHSSEVFVSEQVMLAALNEADAPACTCHSTRCRQKD